MFTKIKRRLLYFETDGNVIPDFDASRNKKSAPLRKTINGCFYIQCVAAISCAATGLALESTVFGRVFAAVAALCVIAVAFFALGGHSGEKLASCILNIIYSVGSFLIGGTVMCVCGALLSVTALAAAVSYIAGYLRDWLMNYPPYMLRPNKDYKLNCDPLIVKDDTPPPPPEKSELREVAEQFMEILK